MLVVQCVGCADQASSGCAVLHNLLSAFSIDYSLSHASLKKRQRQNTNPHLVDVGVGVLLHNLLCLGDVSHCHLVHVTLGGGVNDHGLRSLMCVNA